MGQRFRGCLYNSGTYTWHGKDDEGVWRSREARRAPVGGGLIDELAPGHGLITFI